MPLSQSQLQKLGKRLKACVTAADLRLLDDYRRSFLAAAGQKHASDPESCSMLSIPERLELR